jgi:hypothetical protein
VPTLIGAILLVCVSLALMLRLGVVARASQGIRLAQEGAAIVADPALDDDAKGQRLRRNSTRLAGLFLTIVAITAVAIGAPLAVLWGLDRLGVVSLAQVVALASSPAFIVVSSVAGVAAWLLAARLRR